MAKRSIERYKDIDLDFMAHPHTGDIVTRVNEQAISASIINIIRTMRGERVFQPKFGSNIQNSLFEPMAIETEAELQAQIESAVRLHEPRCVLRAVGVNADHDMNRYEVTIVYEPKNTGTVVDIKFLLDRLR